MKIRNLNGYRVVYMPNYVSSMKNENWKGWIYEHTYFAELSIGRQLHSNEEVHHLDGDRSNNKIRNLLILEKSQHAKLHKYLEKFGVSHSKVCDENGMNSEKPKQVCEYCGLTLQNAQKRFCSVSCIEKSNIMKRITWPSDVDLQNMLSTLPMTEIGRQLGVSDNAVRKHAKKHGLVW